MPSDLTVLVPRKDLTDEHWNEIAAYTRNTAGDVPYLIGTDPRTDSPHWSMSRSLNEARARASTPKILLTPVDYIVLPHILDQISVMLDEHPWWGPFQSVHQLWDGPTRQVLDGAEPHLSMPGDRTVMCMACIAVRAEVFDDVGGMDPRFEGYAPEDAALRRKLIVLYGEPPVPQNEPVFELWTDRSARPNFGITGPLYVNDYLSTGTPEAMRTVIARSVE